jgi:DNA-binding protein HU-beta
MNKADLINQVAAATGLTKTKSGEVIDVITESMKNALVSGEKVTLVGFGTFSSSSRKERKGRNPKTGAVIDIPAKKVVKFKSGSYLADSVNS